MTTWFKKPQPAALILVLLWTMVRLAVLSHTGIPQPAVHDEFGHLLVADTLAHGRLTNPPPALGEFFESPAIIVRPTYISKFLPGQALFLALGQRLFGAPFYGVIIGNALMLFAFCLMLFAWVPYPWALAVSGMLALCLHPGMYWTNSYWGGSVAASGGAFALLGIGMYRARQTPAAGIVFALGGLLLVLTRPFEGGVFMLAVLLVFAKELWRKRRLGAFLAAFSVLGLGAAWICYDNQAITGSPFRMPYSVHDAQYSVTPKFWLLPLRPEPAYSQPRLAAIDGTRSFEGDLYREEQPWPRGFRVGLLLSLRAMGASLGAAVLLTLLLPLAWKNPLYRKMAAVGGVFLVALTLETFHLQHYTAPAWGALALMIAVWAEPAWKFRIRNLPVGAALVIFALTSPLTVGVSGLLQRTWPVIGVKPAPLVWPKRRAALIERLSTLDRPQLVIVRYPSLDWDVHQEWVYNSADIDAQRVILAHDLGTERNRALLGYYPDRTVSLLTFDPGSGRERLEPYPESTPQP